MKEVVEIKQEDTKKIIVNSALKLFANKGYAETSMSRIAKEAGISKGTLYWYFSSKEGMFRELIAVGFDKLTTKVNSLVKSNKPIRELLWGYIEINLQFIEQHKNVAKIIIDNIDKVISKEFKKMMEKKRNKLISAVRTLARKGIKEDFFRDVNNEYLVSYIMNVVNITHEDLIREVELDQQEKIEIIYEFLLNGIGKGGNDVA